MVKYFEELDHPNDFYLNLVSDKRMLKSIDINTIPLEFFEKYKNLFERIEKYNLLRKENNQIYTNSQEIDIDVCNYLLIDSNYIFTEFEESGLSINGIIKLLQLTKEFERTHIDTNINKYLLALYNQLHFENSIIEPSKKEIIRYLYSVKSILEYQNKLSYFDKKEIEESLEYLHNLKIEFLSKTKEEVKLHIPDAWFITPFGHLYNTTGDGGHSKATLEGPFRNIYCDDEIEDYQVYLNSALKDLENEYITKKDYDNFLHFVFDFTSIINEEFELKHKRSYNPKLVKLVAGIKSANAGLYYFFNYLKSNSIDYPKDKEYLMSLKWDDILVRCCGFHKICSISDKIITTSSLNYEEELQEYIKRGWTIDFVKPIVLNPITKQLEEIDDEILITTKMHRLLKRLYY